MFTMHLALQLATYSVRFLLEAEEVGVNLTMRTVQTAVSHVP